MTVKINQHLAMDDYSKIASAHDCEVVLDTGGVEEISGEELTNLARLSFKNKIRFSAINANENINETILLINAIYSFQFQDAGEK